MSEGILALMAVIPIAAIFILMVGFRWPATKAMPLAFGLTFLLVLLVWKTPLNWILASSLNGVVIALKIIIIVFGALTLLFTLRESGALAVTLHKIENGYLIQFVNGTGKTPLDQIIPLSKISVTIAKKLPVKGIVYQPGEEGYAIKGREEQDKTTFTINQLDGFAEIYIPFE